MAIQPPGMKIWENTAPLAVGTTVSPWYDTTGFTTLQVAAAITNGTSGSTTLTVQGSYDGATLDTTLTYGTTVTASTTAAGSQYVIQHTYVRFQVVVATANATVSTFYVQSRA